ncbi:hypothetical protein THIOKS1510010 [Thiocapsa sp. KS1]|nr:hypothetical protein THIOKS1510010 [Thiocapsa sp. KS1]
MRHVSEWLGRAAPTTVGATRLKVLKILNFKLRNTEIEKFSKAKRNMRMMHFALDAV